MRICVVRLVDLVDLNQLQTALGLVVEGQRLSGTLFDEDILRGGVQHLAVRGLGFPGGDGHAGGQAGNGDASVSVGGIDAVVLSHERADGCRHR